MDDTGNTGQRLYHGVMISSTFSDLQQHRDELIKSVRSHGFADISMENDSAKMMDIIDSSLQMVRHSSAYIGVISKKYGQIPKCPRRNPDNLSITELEFNEAFHLGRPILLFIMGKDHLVKESDIEMDPEKRQKLDNFRERAKKNSPDSEVQRVYAKFDDLDEFIKKINPSLSELRLKLNKELNDSSASKPSADIPKAPKFYARPHYTGSHEFVGRKSQLETLNEWCQEANPYNVLLFEAIGGNGKSMLTWQWATTHAKEARADWAGIMWYSFYEKGTTMADFCRHALAYVTGLPYKNFKGKHRKELSDKLIKHLKKKPYLLILDGLERILVAYHRIDFAEVRDEDINQPTDQVAHRDPCDTIQPEDEELLRNLAITAPSKILISSRLVPTRLLNAANQPIPGVNRIPLPGLNLSDAEKLINSCGIVGNSKNIQNYLSTNCDCHPLVIGIIAGLVNKYLPDRGNFDAWETDPHGGKQLNLADLDLVQKRNHILKASIKNLSQDSYKLLSTLALLSGSVDYKFIATLNSDPTDETNNFNATKTFAKSILDLERQGLLQYDAREKRYDLHPVVRGVVVGSLNSNQKEQYGNPIVDYFNSQTHSAFDDVETLEELSNELNLMRLLLKLGYYQKAINVFIGEFYDALRVNLEAHADILSLLQPFFQDDWTKTINIKNHYDITWLAKAAAISLSALDEHALCQNVALLSLRIDLKNKRWNELPKSISFISMSLYGQNRIRKSFLFLELKLVLSELIKNNESLFLARLALFYTYGEIGDWQNAEKMWHLLDPMGRDWIRRVYLPGQAEVYYCVVEFWKGKLNEEQLFKALQLTKKEKNRRGYRMLKHVQGKWELERTHWAEAVKSLSESVQLSRAVSIDNAEAETQLVLAKYHLNEIAAPKILADQLAKKRKPAHLALAELFLAIGEEQKAKLHAHKAYKWAWADGEPFVVYNKLHKARTILEKLGEDVPVLPPYDAHNDKKLPFEDKLLEAIAKLRIEKAGK
ncbi:MAG: DUF4062 domain-containing protein [Bacteroidota bacterium]